MARYKVIVPLLNVRNEPVANFEIKKKLPTVSEGVILELEEETNVPNPALGKWFKDSHGQYYWGGGLQLLTSDFSAPWWIEQLEIQKVWKITKGNGVKVAILDTGYNINLPDLSNAVKASKVFFNSVAGKPVTINDSYGHGSHCASLIAGRNVDNITGCAPDADLYVAKICSQGSVRSYSIIVDAIKWAIDQGVHIISISYGGETPDAALEAIINTAVNQHNIVVVASIGDAISTSSNRPCYPALYPNCLAVGATNRFGQLSSINILSSKTEINAPGDDIPGYSTTGVLENKSGTSQSAAIVSGICALIISQLKAKNQTYTVKSIHDIIKQQSIEVSDNATERLISPTKIFLT